MLLRRLFWRLADLWPAPLYESRADLLPEPSPNFRHVSLLRAYLPNGSRRVVDLATGASSRRQLGRNPLRGPHLHVLTDFIDCTGLAILFDGTRIGQDYVPTVFLTIALRAGTLIRTAIGLGVVLASFGELLLVHHGFAARLPRLGITGSGPLSHEWCPHFRGYHDRAMLPAPRRGYSVAALRGGRGAAFRAASTSF